MSIQKSGSSLREVVEYDLSRVGHSCWPDGVRTRAELSHLGAWVDCD